MGDDGTPRIVQAGTLTRGNTGKDADRPAVMMSLKEDHSRQRLADGMYECKYEGCGTKMKDNGNRNKHEANESLHTLHPSVKSATYRVTSKNPGRDSWTCNADHILVLKFNLKPTHVKHLTDHSRERPFVFGQLAEVAGVVIEEMVSFATKQAADAAREAAVEDWEPLVWEGPVHAFLRISSNLRSQAQMFQPPLVRFGSAGKSLRARLSDAMGNQLPSKQLTCLVAWAIGVWLTDGAVATTNIEQIKEDQNLAADGHDKSHTPIVQRLKLVYEQITGRPAGEDEEPEEEDAEPGIDEDAVMDQLIEEGMDEDEAKAEVAGMMEEAEAEAAPQGIVRFVKFSSAGNPVYRIRMGVVFGRVLKSYKIFHKKGFPHALLSEPEDVRMALLAGIVDGDGFCNQGGREIEVSAKKRRFIDGLVHLARGLGFSTGKVCETLCVKEETGKEYRGFRVHIGGPKLHLVMTALTYKRFQPRDVFGRQANKDPLCDGFTIEEIGHRNYYGFTLNGNGRCIMDDFVVSHNVSLNQLSRAGTAARQ